MLLKKHFLRFISCVDHLLYRLIVFVCLCVEFMRSLTGGMMNRSLRTHTDGSVHGSVGHQTWTATPKFRVKLIINSWMTRKTDLDRRVRSKFMIQLSLAVWSNFTCSVWTKWLGWPACKWPHSCVHALRKRLGPATTVCFLEAVWSSVIPKADGLGRVFVCTKWLHVDVPCRDKNKTRIWYKR